MSSNSIPLLVTRIATNQNLHNLSESKKNKHFESFRCRTPGGDVFEASSIRYEEETENVIVEYEDGIIWFCLSREEYDAQMEMLVETGFCDFKKRLVNTTEEELRKMKQDVPESIKREKHNENVIVGGCIGIVSFVFVAALVSLIWFLNL